MWNAQNITSVIVATLSLVGTIATVAYVKIKSNFRDQQDTEIKITNKINGTNPSNHSDDQYNIPSAETEIIITFNNVEKFASEMVKFKNGGDNNNDIKSIPNLSIKKSKKKNDDLDDHDDMSLDTHTHYDNALKTNHAGDVIIGDNRKTLVEQTSEVVKHIVTQNTEFLKLFFGKTPEIDIESHGNIDRISFKTNDNLKLLSNSAPVKSKKSEKINDHFNQRKTKFSTSFKKDLAENDLKIHKSMENEDFNNPISVQVLGDNKMPVQEIPFENDN